MAMLANPVVDGALPPTVPDELPIAIVESETAFAVTPSAML
jgi:hypothetical protein